MPKIASNILSYDKQPCNRCGSKRRVAKTWKESIPNLTGGVLIQFHSQIVCTNDVCQAEFERLILEDKRKREDLRKARSK